MLALLAPLPSLENGCRQSEKYLKPVNIMSLSDIYFSINKSDIFTNKCKDTLLFTFKQKEIFGLFEKNIVKFVTPKKFSSNVQVFNSCFVYKIKDLYTDKTYKKSFSIMQIYINKNKNLVMI